MGICMIDFNLLVKYYPRLLQGVAVSLQIALVSCAIGAIIGTCLGIILSGNNKIAKFFAQAYVSIVRGTPMLIQITATYLLLKYAGFSISALWSATISIGINSGAYLSQTILTGITSVSKGQLEAAKTLGFTPAQTIRYIIFPQALRTVLPNLESEIVTLIKDSSLASFIGVYELSKQGDIIISQTFDAPTIYFAIGLMYLILTTLVTVLMNILNKKVHTHA
ncbi:nickel transporter [Candidatus Chromulinivorax destructor]|uniref:Nickel transporter n=2 Tax=Candidatus Chromulinivorax destructor TaxID=2066483 RepID=A0A345ZBY6_9BACT|nr:nickel transporter [Candidatus Chromulinivorax destructor]